MPQDVPVLKEIKRPSRNTVIGKREGGRDPESAWERKLAAPSSRRVPLKHQAAMSTKQGERKRPIPLMNSFAGDKPDTEMGFG